MKSVFAGVLLIGVFVWGCTPMSASVQVRSAPPPPAFEFNSDPHFNYLTDRRVSVISDDNFNYDMLSSGRYYYLYNGGYWYRSQSPRGPFVAIEARRVPRQIFDVNDQEYRWRNHPEGWRAGRHSGEGDHRPGDVPRGTGH
jgi:hypothetical protein